MDLHCRNSTKNQEISYQFAICNLLLEPQKPPAPVALQGRLCLSGKPHEYKRSLVWLNLPYPTNWEEPKVRRPPLSISILQRRQGTPLFPFSLFVPDEGNVSFSFAPFSFLYLVAWPRCRPGSTFTPERRGRPCPRWRPALSAWSTFAAAIRCTSRGSPPLFRLPQSVCPCEKCACCCWLTSCYVRESGG